MDIQKDKKIVFYDKEINHANLKIRLKYDGISQGEFFRFLILKYINGDIALLNLIEQYKIESQKMGKSKIKRARRDFEKSILINKDIGITPEEKSRVFDLIESDIVDEEGDF